MPHIRWMPPLGQPPTPNKPRAETAITVRLNRQDYERVVEAAAYSQQTVVEWIQDMCHTATID